MQESYYQVSPMLGPTCFGAGVVIIQQHNNFFHMILSNCPLVTVLSSNCILLKRIFSFYLTFASSDCFLFKWFSFVQIAFHIVSL